MLQTIRELIELLEKDYQPEERVVGFIWGEKDIASIAKDCSVTLTGPEMESLMARLNAKDSRKGLGWKDIKEEINRIEMEHQTGGGPGTILRAERKEQPDPLKREAL